MVEKILLILKQKVKSPKRLGFIIFIRLRATQYYGLLFIIKLSFVIAYPLDSDLSGGYTLFFMRTAPMFSNKRVRFTG